MKIGSMKRKTTGMLFILLGFILLGIGLIAEFWIAAFYGLATICIGIAIFLNKKEDVIEEIKDTKK